jgi:folate-binding protein YgfZ
MTAERETRILAALMSESTGTPAQSTLLRLEGRDALDVLHRVSTQSLADLREGEARATLFCDFRGRLLHRAIVARAPGAVWLLRPDAPGDELAAFVDHYIFREDVKLLDRSNDAIVRARYDGGGGAEGSLQLEHELPARVTLPRGEVIEVFAEGSQAAAPEADGEFARIAAGLPRHGCEIREEFTPYEVGLAAEVHLSKGCYTGQETLLRLMTYESVRRALVRLDLEGDAPSPRSAVRSANERAGEITSAVSAGEAGRAVALAVVRIEALRSESALALESGAVVVQISPFHDTRPLGLPA